MFSANKNQNNSSVNNNPNNQPVHEKIPVHTMQDDLEYLKNPNAHKDEFIDVVENRSASEEKASPFLNAGSDANNAKFPPIQNQPAKPQPQPQIQSQSQFQPQPKPQPQPRPQSQPMQAQSASRPTPTPVVPSALPVSPAPTQGRPIEEEKEEFLKSLAEKREKEKIESVKAESSGPGGISQNGSKKTIFIVAGAIMVILLLAGGYYFWMIQNKNNAINTTPSNSNITNPNPSGNNSVPDQNVQTPPQPQFSVSNPNILSINVDNPTSQDINQLLTKTASDIRSAKITDPLEFMVTDKNNNPVSFSDFATQAGIKLPAALLAGLDKDFSVYFYDNGVNTRLGLKISAKNAVTIKNLMLREEKNLYSDFSPIYIENVLPSPATIKFVDSVYNGYNIRYINVDSGAMTSFDYTVSNSQLILGTSKQTMRAILDKITQENANNAAQTSGSAN